ncbi:hypothetical protein AB1Y20_018868 [Prymnesium parvum]|uniref:Uncharacterized protein n=1 Tax=Prymnesium parvum TaxID=97485 RepID=A0AB34JT05_PRYPA
MFDGEAIVQDEMNNSTTEQSTSENDFDWEGCDDHDDNDDDEDEEGTRLLRDARAWDAFIRLAHSIRPFEKDDAEYRELRVVEAFNAAAEVSRHYKMLQPAAQSACPHVALVVVPRQMVKHGDPNRRGTDQSESYGAAIKDTIHRRCLRRKKGARAEKHTRRRKDGTTTTWMQRPLSVSRVMQTYRDMSVRERLLRDEDSKAYLLRHHFTLASSGFTTVGEAAECSAAECDETAIFDKITRRLAEGRDMA